LYRYSAEPGTKLHYWFARSSAADWARKPTVLWLNGGPGSSSILGFLEENGPLLVNRTGGLMENPWAWTSEANMIALESPAGVGYSYCEAQLGGG
jgi:serine carboxypeptidase-like clade 1